MEDPLAAGLEAPTQERLLWKKQTAGGGESPQQSRLATGGGWEQNLARLQPSNGPLHTYFWNYFRQSSAEVPCCPAQGVWLAATPLAVRKRALQIPTASYMLSEETSRLF